MIRLLNVWVKEALMVRWYLLWAPEWPGSCLEMLFDCPVMTLLSLWNTCLPSLGSFAWTTSSRLLKFFSFVLLCLVGDIAPCSCRCDDYFRKAPHWPMYIYSVLGVSAMPLIKDPSTRLNSWSGWIYHSHSWLRMFGVSGVDFASILSWTFSGLLVHEAE